MKWAERLIAEISPKRALAREIDRYKLTSMQSLHASTPGTQETKWRGASKQLRSMMSWVPRIGSAKSDLPNTERTTLIARSRDAYRSHMIARAAISRSRTNIVGTGLIAHASVDAFSLGISEDEAQRLNDIIDSEWRAYWENPLECDIEATLDGYGLQSLALMSAMLSGDCFALTPYKEIPGCQYGLKVQLVEADRVSNPNAVANTETLIDGVQIQTDGMPIIYWVSNFHPGDSSQYEKKWEPIPVFGDKTGRRRAMHVWNEKDRIGGVRGAPFLAPILEPLQKLEQYSRAELAAAIVSAMLTVFIKKSTQAQVDEVGNPIAAIADTDEKGQLSLGEGAIVDLAPGEEPIEVNPSRPNANFDPFFGAVVKQMGAALGIPVDELLLHYQSSYSAARAAMLQAWRFYTERRWVFAQQFCTPIRNLWFDEAVARGKLPFINYADPKRRAAYTNTVWVGPSRGSMDEEKEASAAKIRIETGLSNEAIETAAMQGDAWADVYRQRKREINQRRLDKMLPSDINPQTTANAGVSVPGATQ